MNITSIPLPLIANNISLFGNVGESKMTKSYLNSKLTNTSTIKVYRLDASSGGLSVVEDSANAVSAALNSFLPFGNNALVAGSVIKVFDSEDGVWASHEITTAKAYDSAGVQHASIVDCLKATGWCRIDFGTNTNRKSWKPSNDPVLNAPSKPYIRVELDNGTEKDSFIFACAEDITSLYLSVGTAGSTSAPVRINNIELLRDNSSIKWIDRTSFVNGDGSYTPSPAKFLVVPGIEFLYGAEKTFYAIELYSFLRNGASLGTVWKVELSGANGTWIDITSGVNSESNFYRNGPATLQTTATHFTDTFTPPSTWVKRSVGTLNLEAGGTEVTPSLYYLRFTVASTDKSEPENIAAVRVRLRQYGAENFVGGVKWQTGGTIQKASLKIRGAVTGTGARNITLAEAEGSVRTLTIPASTVQGATVEFSITPLTIPANGVFGIINPSTGGIEFSDAVLLLE